MFIKKVYGQSQATPCYFCDKRATTENNQGIPTCIEHKIKELQDQKCVCGKTFEIKKSRYGAFFLCQSCGPVSLKKAKQEKTISSEYNINKKYRKQETTYDKNKVYTLEELENIWK